MSRSVGSILGSVGVIVGVVCAIGLREHLTQQAWTQHAEVAHKSPQEVVAENATWADQQGRVGLEPHLGGLREFFAEARRGTRPFAQQALSFESKLKLVGDKLFGTYEHDAYVSDAFATHIFQASQIDAAVEQTVRQYVRHLDDVENQMLVRLQVDLSELPRDSFAGTKVDLAQLQSTLSEAVQKAVEQVQGEFVGALGRELVSWIASEVLTNAATQFAVSAGILGTGAAGGAATFGVSIVIGFIVDYIASWIYTEVADPEGTMSRMLDEKLLQLEESIIHGDGTTPGLAGQLSHYAERRGAARRQALDSAVSNPAAVDLAF